jgi:hypothetical protein
VKKRKSPLVKAAFRRPELMQIFTATYATD